MPRLRQSPHLQIFSVPPRPRGLLNYKCLNRAPRTTTPLAFARGHSTTQTFHRSQFLQQSCQRSCLAETLCFAKMQLLRLRNWWKKNLLHRLIAPQQPSTQLLRFSTSYCQPNEDTRRAMHITSSSTSVGDSSTGTVNTARKRSSVAGSITVDALQTSPPLTDSTKTPWSMR